MFYNIKRIKTSGEREITMSVYEGKCPSCQEKVEIEFNEDLEECPKCGHGGYWDEKYTEDNYWMVWYWDGEE